MKSLIIFLTLILLSCSSSNDNANAKENLLAKNRETATRNEAIRLVKEAQKLEQEGRAMDIYRQYQSEINTKACAKVSAEKNFRMEDFQDRVKSLPENYKSKLTPIFEDLSKCVNCDKKAIESCKTARATLNQIIKEVFPE